MGAGEIIAIVIIALVIGGAAFYIIKSKKSGRKCIGCPDGASCQAHNGDKKCGGCSGNCSCCGQDALKTQDENDE